MANSIITYAGTAGAGPYAINFTLGNLSRDYVKCRVNDEVDGLGDPVYRTITWITDGSVTIGGAVPTGVDTVVFTRTIPDDALIHDYSNGAPITEANLDQSNLQNIMLIHQFLDGRLTSPLQNDLDMNDFKIINLADGTDPTDAVNLSQLQPVLDVLADTLAAQAAAEAAQAAAEVAQAAAELAETNAETAETNAEAAETNAEAAQAAAEAAKAAAESAQAAAELAETNAETAETNAETAATTATTQAGIATTQAGLAETARIAAQLAETNAETAETNAETAEANAEAAQAAAEAIYDAFDDRYLGSKIADPALDNDGNALITGAMYFNSSTNLMKVYNGATWDNVNALTPTDDSVTNAKLANMAEATIKGRASGAGTGDPSDLTGAQVATIIGNATDALSGVVELATVAETTTGTDTNRAVTPAGVAAAIAAITLDKQTFTASGTWTKPAKGTIAHIRVWGGGGGGYNGGGSFGGGGGGGYNETWVLLSSLGATETVTIGAGGAIATAGGNTTFGSHLTGYGGGTTTSSGGGGGGGMTSKGSDSSSTTGAAGGGPDTSNSIAGGGKGGDNGASGTSSFYGGGGGCGGGGARAGHSVYGGGGGGSTGASGGTSVYAGAGGGGAANGTAPAGGGGRNAAGAAGQCIVEVF